MYPDVRKYVDLLWLTFAIMWCLGALLQKKVARREPSRSRVAYLVLVILAVSLMYDKSLGLGPLGTSFLPKNWLFAYLGLGLTFTGISFAAWARLSLGGNWSGAVTVKKDHKLIRNGPYALVRHPIYTGVLVALLGTTFVLTRTRCLLAFGIAVLALSIKLRREEQFMTEQFGAEYTEYSQDVKALIPFIW